MKNISNALANFCLAVDLNPDDMVKIDRKVRWYKFHANCLKGYNFGSNNANLAAAIYRADNDIHDLQKEAGEVAWAICKFNTMAKMDPAIGEGFLERRYNFRASREGTNTDSAYAESLALIDLYDKYRDEYIKQKELQQQLRKAVGLDN